MNLSWGAFEGGLGRWRAYVSYLVRSVNWLLFIGFVCVKISKYANIALDRCGVSLRHVFSSKLCAWQTELLSSRVSSSFHACQSEMRCNYVLRICRRFRDGIASHVRAC